jgi:hypothetical protein
MGDIGRGFDMMTLGPSPRLPQLRARLRRRNYYLEARKDLDQVRRDLFGGP